MATTATIGVFDGVHRGHRYLIEQLHKAARGSRPLVVTFPDHPVAILAPERAPKLLTLAPEKRRLLEAENVDVAMMNFDRAFAATSARDFICRLRSDYDVERLLLGYNNRFGADRGLSHDDYKTIGAEEGVEVVTARPFTIPVATDDETARLNVSSTAIRRMLDRGDIAAANRMLGRSFSLSGIVES
ncbi:MAG: FAD synthetase family protein, partial [Muribaculaceae bacterium]|nr:FAD synthetase family protein [Muribaculaceae bacterium]